jgi:hypothetical protein
MGRGPRAASKDTALVVRPLSQHLGHRLNADAEIISDLCECEAICASLTERLPADGGKPSDHLAGESGKGLRSARTGQGFEVSEFVDAVDKQAHQTSQAFLWVLVVSSVAIHSVIDHLLRVNHSRKINSREALNTGTELVVPRGGAEF